jgi:hypothetical protein
VAGIAAALARRAIPVPPTPPPTPEPLAPEPPAPPPAPEPPKVFALGAIALEVNSRGPPVLALGVHAGRLTSLEQGEELLQARVAGLFLGPSYYGQGLRLVLDLRGLEGWDEAAAHALAARWLPWLDHKCAAAEGGRVAIVLPRAFPGRDREDWKGPRLARHTRLGVFERARDVAAFIEGPP